MSFNKEKKKKLIILKEEKKAASLLEKLQTCDEERWRKKLCKILSESFTEN